MRQSAMRKTHRDRQSADRHLAVAAVYLLRLRAIALALRGPPAISRIESHRRSQSAATVIYTLS